MSAENDIAQRIASPLSSGRSSPINIKARQKDDDALLKRDKGYRRYASTVERVLAQFDTAVEEWADYISFLGRLLKALSIKPSGFADIPHKTHVAKRLSQCLNPKLPSGVHQKTLEVYAYIFSTLGRDGLSTDLALYLPGLTPILSFAALSVKPNVLSIFESHIVPLQSSALRPALKSLLLALLPGLEEENSEEFDRTLRILQALKGSVAGDGKSNLDEEESSADQYFWQCMFLACITSFTRRSGGLAYLSRYLPNLGNSPTTNRTGATTNGNSTKIDHQTRLKDAIGAVVSPEPGLLIRCFCACLQDPQPLIQRGFLDLLVTRLPLNSAVLQERVVSADLEKLVIAATSVVARKDMSLNRRLWSWFLGPEPSSEANGTPASPASPRPAETLSPTQNLVLHQTRHFEKYGLKSLVDGVLSMIRKDSNNAAERTKPLRISTSLMDRWEIGSLVVPKIFLPAMKGVWEYQKKQNNEDAQSEILKSANMFFDGVESSLIWSELFGVISWALNLRNFATSSASDMLQMVDFIVHNFNIREEEMQTVHMPLSLLTILFRLLRILGGPVPLTVLGAEDRFFCSLKVANRVLELIPPRVFVTESQTIENPTRLSPPDDEFLSFAEEFYAKHKGNIEVHQHFSKLQLSYMLLESSFKLVTALMNLNASQLNSELDSAISFLAASIRKIPNVRPNLNRFFASLANEGQDSGQQVAKSFAITSAKVSILEAIHSTSHSSSWISSNVCDMIFPALIRELWLALSPLRPKYSVEAVRCIWRLYSICQNRQIIDSTLVTLMIGRGDDFLVDFVDAENIRKFSTLWAHTPSTSASSQGRRSSLVTARPESEADVKPGAEMSLLERPLMLLLESLGEPHLSLFPLIVNWLQSLSTLTPILNLLMSRLANVRTFILVASSEDVSAELSQEEDPDGLQVCLYYLRTILHVIEHATNAWPALSNTVDSKALIEESVPSIQDRLTEICMRILQGRSQFKSFDNETRYQLYQTALALLKQFYSGSLAQKIAEKKLEDTLIEELIECVEIGEYSLQTSLMEVILAALKCQHVKQPLPPKTPRHQRNSSKEFAKATPTLSIATESGDTKAPARPAPQLPEKLLESIILGLKAPASRPVLESWTTFLGHCLPLYEDRIFQVLLPLVGCFCKTLDSILSHAKEAYRSSETEITQVLDPTIALLLNGLEQSLATAHDVLATTEAKSAPVKTPEPQPTGFFGNMVSGVFATDVKNTKTLTANNRLTVLLCFKDSIRICFSYWSWGDANKENSLQDSSAWASFNYITLRLRNRTRRIFEHLFAAEALECLESLIELWQQLQLLGSASSSSLLVFDLLGALESSRPKITVPAIFNSIYSRTNPSALELSRKSTLTSSLDDITAASFLVAYVRSLDDDAMDEIWTDCITFLKDVLANPMPHRQILPKLIEFNAVLGMKVDNTTFGEQRRMRRELGDLFVRLLTATLTIRPTGVMQEVTGSSDKLVVDGSDTRASLDNRQVTGTDGLVYVLAAITPNISKVLVDSERVVSAMNIVCNQVLAPIFRSRAFPENVNQYTLELVQVLFGISEASKSIKRDVGEAFNDPKFFSTPVSLAQTKWLTILRSWSLGDKERMPDLLSRLSSPASAGVLGIGATSARTEADRKTQLNLRRIALLVLAAAEDTYVTNLAAIQDKLVDLLNATTSSSPSSTTRAEIYMVVRAMLLKISSIHLAPLWPTINSELFDAISSAYPTADAESKLHQNCLLQACKLLDTLLTLEFDEFQMQEWLFISDTTDAVYRPPHLSSVALVDDLTEALDEQKSQASGHLSTDTTSEKRKPILTRALTKEIPRDRMLDKVLRPFFRQLSINAFESTYGMQTPDRQACFDELMADLFDDSTLV